jgi:imidazolonepropionase-like amidohydrolase
VVSRCASTLLAALALAACRSAQPPEPAFGDLEQALQPLGEGESGCVVVGAKVFVLDDQDTVLAPGMVVVRDGRIAAVGAPRPTPPGFERREFPAAWITPGLIDLHSHVQTGGWGDINDMVLPINAEFRTSPTIRPGNPEVRRACAAGVTTLFGIPGSGTSMSGFGVLYKTKGDCTYEEAVFADPGGLKVAQDSNPQRGAGDFGVSRAALAWLLNDVNDRARAASELAGTELDRSELALRNLERVHAKELPILIHTAGSEGVANTSRMWRKTYDTRSVLSHGCFDGWKVRDFVAQSGIPVNNGPRMIEYQASREGRVIGICSEYAAAGAQLISINTDSPVVPQEELFLQGGMAARYGLDETTALRALTIHPARAFGIDDRLGSLEAGKDADLAVFAGNPLDPRSRVELVLIDGEVEYDREREGQRF